MTATATHWTFDVGRYTVAVDDGSARVLDAHGYMVAAFTGPDAEVYAQQHAGRLMTDRTGA